MYDGYDWVLDADFASTSQKMRGDNRNGVGDTHRGRSGDLDGWGRCGVDMVVDAGASRARLCAGGEKVRRGDSVQMGKGKEGRRRRRKVREVFMYFRRVVLRR